MTYNFTSFANGFTDWVGEAYFLTRTSSYRKTTYKTQNTQMMWGMYFYYSQEMIYHSRQAKTFFDVLSEFGGVMVILYYFFGLFARWFNNQLERGKLIKSIYFKPDFID
jgi:hypothetical protein